MKKLGLVVASLTPLLLSLACGSDAPTDTDSTASALAASAKIKYVLIIIKENHTFDNLFMDFPGADTSKTAVLSDGKVLRRTQAPSGAFPTDLHHGNDAGQIAYARGRMNGWDRMPCFPQSASKCIPEAHWPFTYYSENQIPSYWSYARDNVIADHFFSTTLGPSVPGHIAFWTSFSPVLGDPACLPGGKDCGGYGCTAGADVRVMSSNPLNCSSEEVKPCFEVPSLADHLPSGFTWRDYGGEVAMMVKSVVQEKGFEEHFRGENSLLTDLQHEDIANLTIAHLWDGEKSEHPPDGPCDGENQDVELINAAMKSPQWEHMAILMTWDDWGGFYDHVTPPVHTCGNGQVYESGFRVPLIVISPYAKKGYVLKNNTEQASVPRLIEDLWGMKYMSKRDSRARDGHAGSLMAAFDFNQKPRAAKLLSTRVCP